jgi:hypothetical protein
MDTFSNKRLSGGSVQVSTERLLGEKCRKDLFEKGTYFKYTVYKFISKNKK